MIRRMESRSAWARISGTLAVASTLMILGCSGQSERSDTAKQQFQQAADAESRLLKQPGSKGLRRGLGAPKTIKGKLGGLEKEPAPSS